MNKNYILIDQLLEEEHEQLKSYTILPKVLGHPI